MASPINSGFSAEVEHITNNTTTYSSKLSNMSSAKCGNCDCSDQSTCVKKGYSADIVETEKSYNMEETMVMNAPEHDGKCKCGSSCTCTNCTCNH